MDPYKVLGVSYDATDDEIKSEYRKLSRKYHPDANVGNPHQKEYEEKFKEIQQAYSIIMDQRQGKTTAQNGWGSGYSQGGNGQGGYTYGQSYGNQGYDGQDFNDFWNAFFGFGGGNQGGYQQNQQSYTSQEDAYLNSAVNYIRSGYYREGLNVLEQIPKERREAPWFYYSAFANYKVGNNVLAAQHSKAACELDPNNMEYRRLYNGITGAETRYQQQSTRYGGNPTMKGSNYCAESCAASLCLSSCLGGGGLIGLPILCCI